MTPSNGNDPAMELATEALRVARNADDSVLNLHESFGGVTRELAGVKIEMGAVRGAVTELGRSLDRLARKVDGRASKHDLEEVKDELDDTKTMNLKAMLAASQTEVKNRTRIFVAVLALIGSMIAAGVKLLH